MFAQATENLASGPNQFGGSKFATAIRGNAEQAASLESAVKALPAGNQKWNGFSRFLDVMEATGQRLQVGSATAFNQQGQEELRGRGAIKAVAGLKSEIMRRWDQHSLAGNSEAVAQLLTNSTATDIFKRLAKENGVTPQAVALTHRLQGIMASNASAFDRAQARAAETARPQPVQ